MQPCACCSASRETAGNSPYFDPACLFCGGRLIAKLGTLKQLPSIITQRRKNVLKDWMQMGHSEARLRELAKAPESLEPIENRQIRPPDIGRNKRKKL